MANAPTAGGCCHCTLSNSSPTQPRGQRHSIQRKESGHGGLTAFSQIPLTLFGCLATALGGVCSLGGESTIGRLVLQHLLDDWVLGQVHLQVAEVQARRNDIHEGHVAPCPAPVAQHLLQRWVEPAYHGMASLPLQSKMQQVLGVCQPEQALSAVSSNVSQEGAGQKSRGAGVTVITGG